MKTDPVLGTLAHAAPVGINTLLRIAGALSISDKLTNDSIQLEDVKDPSFSPAPALKADLIARFDSKPASDTCWQRLCGLPTNGEYVL